MNIIKTNEKLHNQVMESEEMKQALENFRNAEEKDKRKAQLLVGKTANKVATRILKAKGWSLLAISKALEIPVSSVRQYSEELDK